MGRILIGVGGWTFEPWRGPFYPDGLPQRRELEYASRHLTSIEINGTYYRTQKPETFAGWAAETPEGFVFALKAVRYATNRRVLAEAAESVTRFVDSGLDRLGWRLGPVNWQLAPTKKFDPEDISAFLALLPAQAGDLPLRHAIEARHPSFADPEFARLCAARNVAVIRACDGEYPEFDIQTADFSYLRIMGTTEDNPLGYSTQALDEWAGKLKALATRGDVFAYVISGHKERNPAAAMALIERLA